MIQTVLHSSRSEEWSTPRDLFNLLDDEFNFTLDPCATPANTKCRKFFTKDHNGLVQNRGNEIVFCNPPYGKCMRQWPRKCHDAALNSATVVLLAHARTDTRWLHDRVYRRAAEIRFVRGRLKFWASNQSAPFPSLIAIFKSPKMVGDSEGH